MRSDDLMASCRYSNEIPPKEAKVAAAVELSERLRRNYENLQALSTWTAKPDRAGNDATRPRFKQTGTNGRMTTALLMTPSNGIRTIETKTKFVWVHDPDTESGVGGCDKIVELTIILP